MENYLKLITGHLQSHNCFTQMDWISNMFSTSFGKWRQATFFEETEGQDKFEKKGKENDNGRTAKNSPKKGSKPKSIKKSKRSPSRN
jgi:hypothetical protein